MIKKAQFFMINNEEHELIVKSCTGESSAFRMLMEKYQKKIYYLALDMTGNLHDAEDLTQEIFIKAFKGLPNFRGDAKLSSWLYRIAINTIIDKRRKKRMVLSSYHGDTSDDYSDYSSWITQDNPEKSAESQIMQRHIYRALQKLSNRERSVFVLRHYNDLRLEEIAKILQLCLQNSQKSLLKSSFRHFQRATIFTGKKTGKATNIYNTSICD